MRIAVGAVALGSILFWTSSARAEEQPDLSNLTIEQLAQIKVTSASKQAQPLSDAAAAIYVIDHDQIVRSGAVTIPEIVRLAPNLQVYRSSPSNWIVTARGLSGRPFAQSYSNKLLVLVDGRTVYTPLFSGVYWDLPDLIPDDIDRIEVISGPGATLWGANAVNGVINIITRSGASDPGVFVDAEAGTGEQVAGVRVAGRTGQQLTYRAYVRYLKEDAFDLATGGSARDGWHRLGGGFRVDWTPSAQDSVTLQGDIFGGRENQLTGEHEDISGHNLVLRWNRSMSPDRQLQVQAFYDRVSRGAGSSSGSFFVDTYDVDMQDSFPVGRRNKVVWGGGARVAHYLINGTPNFFFDPAGRNLFLANAFAQDTLAISKAVSLTAGLKAERDPYVGTSLLPNVILSVKPVESSMIWAAVSRAVRSATPFDEDVYEAAPGVTLQGNREFRTEKLTAYELGVHSQPLTGLSFSASGFYHHYNDLRSVEVGPGPGLNLYWSNELAGNIYGVDAWASASALPWWTLSVGATVQHEQMHFKAGATLPQIGTGQNGADPRRWLTLQSSMDLGHSVTLDVHLRSVGHLRNSDVRAYSELGGRLAWSLSDRLQLSLSGENLLHARHVEYPGGDAIPRKVLVGLQFRP
jgi:iron complex outermembrane receptor protein